MMKRVVIATILLCIMSIGIASVLYQKVREQAVSIDVDVISRVAKARLHRNAMQFLLEDNHPMLVTNLAYLVYMDTTLADVAYETSLSQKQKAVLREEARLARQLLDHPALTSFVAALESNNLLRSGMLRRKDVTGGNQ